MSKLVYHNSEATPSAPLIWLSADYGVTVDINNKVSNWSSRTGSYNAVQNTQSKKPLLTTNPANQKKVLYFDLSTVTDLVITSTVNVGTMFVVANYTYGTTFLSYSNLITPANTNYYFLGNSGGISLYSASSAALFRNNIKVDNILTTNIGNINNYHVFSGKDALTRATTSINIGSSVGYPGNQSWTGNIHEIIIYSTVLTNEQETTVYNYLRLKYNL